MPVAAIVNYYGVCRYCNEKTNGYMKISTAKVELRKIEKECDYNPTNRQKESCTHYKPYIDREGKVYPLKEIDGVCELYGCCKNNTLKFMRKCQDYCAKKRYLKAQDDTNG